MFGITDNPLVGGQLLCDGVGGKRESNPVEQGAIVVRMPTFQLIIFLCYGRLQGVHDGLDGVFPITRRAFVEAVETGSRGKHKHDFVRSGDAQPVAGDLYFGFGSDGTQAGFKKHALTVDFIAIQYPLIELPAAVGVEQFGMPVLRFPPFELFESAPFDVSGRLSAHGNHSVGRGALLGRRMLGRE